MEPIVVPVDDGGHAAHHLAILPRQEELRFGIGVERMLLAVEQFLYRDAQRRHPIRIVTVERERQFHKLLQRLLACLLP